MIRLFIYLTCLFILPCMHLLAHEARPAYLEMKQLSEESYQLFWKVPAKGPTEKLSLELVFPETCSVRQEKTSFFTSDAWVEKGLLFCSEGLEGQTIEVRGLPSTQTDVLVRLENRNGEVQVYRVSPKEPRFIITDDQSLIEVAKTYTLLGIEHIWSGVDHLLFVLVLLIFIEGWIPLVGAITAFTVAHSITLAAAVLGFVYVPSPPVEACIALSIVFVAREILRKNQGTITLSEQYPWIVAFAFGIMHGFGFAGALSETGLPQNDIPLALFSFNVGVEIGQLLFVFIMLLLIGLLKRVLRNSEKRLEWIVTYSIGGYSAFLMIERIAQF